MLNYQTTSYHDVATVRRTLGLRPAPAFETWLEANGLWLNGSPAPQPAWPTSLAELDATAVSGRPVRELVAQAAA
jgi:ethanolamine ammonia-lyase large subunit